MLSISLAALDKCVNRTGKTDLSGCMLQATAKAEATKHARELVLRVGLKIWFCPLRPNVYEGSWC